MTRITELNDHRAHYCIPTPDGKAHVVPEAMIENIISGKISIDDVDDRDQVIRAILKDWLNIKLREGRH
ncbi:hypothetical protein KUW00_15655 [Halomonas sp. DP5N14-9]|uniref:hypothetical protein n=1 Tax=Halomonas sp. DP5N14-9 TaxID=2859075 RepID=UPI001C99FAFF|nr:hypothetical protein [Halomonas sp. DP5N14-9]MBY5942315.1 hypothetical protein [Halomonas sp. DP5N14-9]